jgi:hypothetical protein
MSGLSKATLPQGAPRARVLLVIGLPVTLAACAPRAYSPGASRKAIRAADRPPRPIAVSHEAADRLTQRMSEALSSDETLQLLTSEEEFTSYVAQALQDSSAHDALVWFTPGQIHFVVQVRWHRDYALQGIIVPACRDGKVQLQLDRATLDGFALPRLLTASIAQATNDALADAQSSLWIERVVPGEGNLLIIARRD